MYESFYGLQTPPFELTANPKLLLLTPMHREALSMLEYGINARKGIMVLTGEAGTGKTTLIRTLLSKSLLGDEPGAADCVHVTNPMISRGEFLGQVADGFGIDRELSTDKPAMLKALQASLIEARAANRIAAVIVDEAQSLSDELIEELRLLANIEQDDAKLLQLVLVGQPELARRLEEHRFRQFKQRIALRCQLGPLDLAGTVAYIMGRVRSAGGDAREMFSREAVSAIHAASGGIARTINVICDNALLTGFAVQKRKIDAAIIGDVCRDLSLRMPVTNRSETGEAQRTSGSVWKPNVDAEAAPRRRSWLPNWRRTAV